MTKKDDPRLKGRHPEFARMSLKPGIGAGAMELIAGQLSTEFGMDEIIARGDVPTHLVLGRKKVPLGRYLSKKLREAVGMPEGWNDAAKEKFTREESEKLSALWSSKGGGKGNSTLTRRETYLKENRGRFDQVEWRHKNLGKKDSKI